MKVYMKPLNKRYDATAEYDVNSNSIIVLKGSRVSDVISTSATFRSLNRIKKFREEYVENNIVKTDVVFSSSSMAASFVTGVSADGLRSWRDENGITLKLLLDEIKR